MDPNGTASVAALASFDALARSVAAANVAGSAAGALDVKGFMLLEDQAYDFSLELVNFMGQASVSALRVLKGSAPIPKLMIQGNPRRSIYRSQKLEITATATATSCGGGGGSDSGPGATQLTSRKLTYIWEMYDGVNTIPLGQLPPPRPA